MQSQLKVLIVEDVPTDAELALRELKKAGLAPRVVRVETEADYLRQLDEFAPDIILSDFTLPNFDGLSALRLARDKCPDTPFIFVSGTIGEEVAIDALKRGAVDYILKTNLKRLGPAVERALQDVEERQARLSIERQLNEARIRFELFMRYMPGAAFIKDARGRYQFVNWSWEEIRGRKMEEVLGRTDGNLWPELVTQLENNERLVIDRNEPLRSIEMFPRPDGVHHYLVHKFPIRDRDGQPVLVGGISIDYTDRLRAEEKIARLSRIHAVLSGINSTIVRVRDRMELFREACRIAVEAGGFGLAWIGLLDKQTLEIKPVVRMGRAEALLDAPWLSAREDVPEGQGIAGRALRARKPVLVNDIASDPRVRRAKELLERGFKAVVALPLLLNEQAIGILGLYADETGAFDQQEMKLLMELAGDISYALGYIEKEETLNYLAYYDALTGLPNRTLFLERVNQVIRSARQDNGRLALVLLDLQRFRAINDTLGRQASDTLLKLVATRMQECLGERGWNARIGGNTFAVALSDIKQETDIAHILEGCVFEFLRQPFMVENTELRLAARLGVALFPGDGMDADSLFRNAEAALKKAKDTGEHYLFYAPEMNARVGEQLNLENRLRVALVERQFVLHYQPVVDSASGRVVGLEALIRWNSPGLGLISPLEFVPILEETGMILEAGIWVLRQAASDYQQWRAKGLKPPRIAVNISALQMRQKDFAEQVQTAMRGEDGEIAALDLEITESVIMTDIEQSIPKLEVVRALGAGIAIDDFGTGYSSLSYLARLPVTALKIDRTFVDNMVASPDSMAIVSSVISLAHSLNLKVVAEGVETKEQWNLLKLLKCDELQGYVFSRPQPAEAVETMLRGNA